MPGQVRVGLDSHIGHASPTPNPFHKTSYASGSPNVNANGAAVVIIVNSVDPSDLCQYKPAANIF